MRNCLNIHIAFALLASLTCAPALAQPVDPATSPAITLPATPDALRAALTAMPELNPQMIERLMGQAQPAVILQTTPAPDDKIATGASKFGGSPDLPANMAWPERPPYPDAQAKRDRHRTTVGVILARAGIAPDWLSPEEGKRYVEERRKLDKQASEGVMNGNDPDVVNQLMRAIFDEQLTTTPGKAREDAKDATLQARMVSEPAPLSFIAQIDLAEMAKQPGFDRDLPDTGRLLLFYDLMEMPAGFEPGSRAGWKLIWDQTPVEQLKQQVPPAALSSTAFSVKLALAPAAVTATSVISPIAPSDADWDSALLPPLPADRYANPAYWAYAEWLPSLGYPADFNRANHQLGGRPQPLQNGMQALAQLAFNSLPAGRPDDYKTAQAVEFLKNAGDWKLVLQIGRDDATGLNAGALYVLMRREDLLARRFENAWVVEQSD